MSADNWVTCPQCKAIAEKTGEAALLEAGAAYGKVPPEKYLAMISAANQKPGPLETTLREDYEVYTTEEGLFRVSYRSSCEECGYSFNYEHEEIPPLKNNK